MDSFKIGLLIVSILLSQQALASEPMFPKLYEVTTEIGMPHLEENLRYATTRETSCLTRFDPFAFPILEHEALKGCNLKYDNHCDETICYVLSCIGQHGTTGEARWRIDSNQIRGTLNVKLDGKNMTFTSGSRLHRSVSAFRQSHCPSVPHGLKSLGTRRPVRATVRAFQSNIRS